MGTIAFAIKERVATTTRLSKSIAAKIMRDEIKCKHRRKTL